MSRATPQVRATLRNVMRREGFDVDGRVTSFHRQLAEQANVAPPPDGELVDTWLTSMQHAEAINLLRSKRLAP
jgi:hypothetical protein